MSSITVKQKLGVVALPYTLMFMLLLVLVDISSNIYQYNFMGIPNRTFVFCLYLVT